jgi:hypothetical protein
MNLKPKDQIRLGSDTDQGHGGAIRRSNGKIIGFGTFSEVKEGQPIREGAELIRVGAEDDEGWRDVTTVYEHERSGPAQVATPAYRSGYDRIFSKKQEVGLT